MQDTENVGEILKITFGCAGSVIAHGLSLVERFSCVVQASHHGGGSLQSMGSRVWALVVVGAPWHAESARTRDGGHHSLVFWLQADISDTILISILCMGPVFPCLIILRGWAFGGGE